MANDAVDPARRRLLAGTAGALGGVGLATTAVPFISSMQPSAKTQAAGAPVEVDIGKLAPGELMVIEWRRRPVWILRRTQEELDNLAKVSADALRDPESAESEQPAYAEQCPALHQAGVPGAAGRVHAPGLFAAGSGRRWPG